MPIPLDNMNRVGAGLHDLLPWYLNGTLDTDEARTFEAHLDGCSPCLGELGPMRQLEEAISRHREAFFEPHPDPGSIVAEAFDRLSSSEAGRIHMHLSFCPTCALESRLAREGREEGDVTPTGTTGRRSRWRRAL